jgi:hypothetical protein
MTAKKIIENLSLPTSSRSLSTGQSFLDFSNFSAGDTVYNLGNGITVTATKQTVNGLVPGKAMVFDSANPSGQDSDLGTPNVRFGGPGIGKDGGGPTKLFPNTMPRGNILIISEDENSSDPDDNAMGGELHFTFDPPRYLATVGLLDNDGTFDMVLKILHRNQKTKAFPQLCAFSRRGYSFQCCYLRRWWLHIHRRQRWKQLLRKRRNWQAFGERALNYIWRRRWNHRTSF